MSDTVHVEPMPYSAEELDHQRAWHAARRAADPDHLRRCTECRAIATLDAVRQAAFPDELGHLPGYYDGYADGQRDAARQPASPDLRAALLTVSGTLDGLLRFHAALPEESAFANVRVSQLAGMKAVADAALGEPHE